VACCQLEAAVHWGHAQAVTAGRLGGPGQLRLHSHLDGLPNREVQAMCLLEHHDVSIVREDVVDQGLLSKRGQ
jgi:hypothetical protein